MMLCKNFQFLINGANSGCTRIILCYSWLVGRIQPTNYNISKDNSSYIELILVMYGQFLNVNTGQFFITGNAINILRWGVTRAVIKGELTKFFLIFVFLRSSIINFAPKIFPSKNVFNLIKSAIVFS